MLPKELRLKKRGSFTYVYNRGERKSAGLLSVIYVRSKSLKVGFSVSNKVGNAVVRNKLKRRLRAIMRDRASELINVQAVVVTKPSAAELGFTELKNTVDKILKNSKLFKSC